MTLYFVQKRIAEIKEFRAKADEKLRISAKRDRITETPDPPLDLDAKIIEKGRTESVALEVARAGVGNALTR